MRVTKRIFEASKDQKDNEVIHDIVVVAGKSEFKCHRLNLQTMEKQQKKLFPKTWRSRLSRYLCLALNGWQSYWNDPDTY
ncbi:hypothetical protein PoB_005307900 [Plakobranchus ocellatus]|uniref:BTB domain-containing protein n=1 Tax=Plakobranchus ocellatus TaxID=259542 RepID=A0AAV4C694_9GAST|nr:hypothetical protein PoB_005307900 [Plakobranchus ocellatus]